MKCKNFGVFCPSARIIARIKEDDLRMAKHFSESTGQFLPVAMMDRHVLKIPEHLSKFQKVDV